MTDPSLDRYTVKEILTEFVVPELREKADRVDVENLERDVRQLQAKILTPESVAGMIGVALERKEARGWTTKERAMGVIVLLFTGIGAAFALLQIVVLLSG
jgi:hypothetical protein